MSLAFGTSGLRGLVSEMTPQTIAAWTNAFLVACPPPGQIFVGRDLRPSSAPIAEQVRSTARAAGLAVIDCGVLPTPALALAAEGASAIMVTGSHIPADRNGLKFYTPAGEITKEDEAALQAAHAGSRAPSPGAGTDEQRDALAAYAERYTRAFGPGALAGLRIGIYQHSSVARDLLLEVIAALGAEAVPLARSDTFIPVDTEAVDPGTRSQLATWCASHRLDAIVSTDGDADRPMVTDATGATLAGDVLGVLTARALGAESVVTPVSSNSMVSAGLFPSVVLTRIGSPFVIAGMTDLLAASPAARVVGFEANGGFLLGFAAATGNGHLAPLMTRDSLLPILAPLVAAHRAGETLAEAVAKLPARFTAADRLKGIPTSVSASLLDRLAATPDARTAVFAEAGQIAAVDTTDGLRLTFATGDIVHLRPSGNAPELRVYTEAGSPEAAQLLLARWLSRAAQELAP